MQGESRGPNKPALFKAAGLLLMIFAAFFILPSVYEIDQATQAADWTPRRAVITQAEIAQYGGGRAHDIPLHAIDMQGRFLDTDEGFSVERIAFGGFNDADQIRAIVEQHPVGSELVVYASPDDPHRVVLVKNADIGAMIAMIALGGVCALGGILTFFKGSKARRALKKD